MGKMFAIVLMSLMATQSFGATVRSAKLDASKKYILIDVIYGGGCGEHEFSLNLGLCLESSPVQCGAELVEKTNDACEAIVYNTVVIPLEQYKLNDSYFKEGSLTITGDKDWQTNEPSRATVRLP